jgi:hypothetical protein
MQNNTATMLNFGSTVITNEPLKPHRDSIPGLSNPLEGSCAIPALLKSLCGLILESIGLRRRECVTERTASSHCPYKQQWQLFERHSGQYMAVSVKTN